MTSCGPTHAREKKNLYGQVPWDIGTKKNLPRSLLELWITSYSRGLDAKDGRGLATSLLSGFRLTCVGRCVWEIPASIKLVPRGAKFEVWRACWACWACPFRAVVLNACDWPTRFCSILEGRFFPNKLPTTSAWALSTPLAWLLVLMIPLDPVLPPVAVLANVDWESGVVLDEGVGSSCGVGWDALDCCRDATKARALFVTEAVDGLSESKPIFRFCWVLEWERRVAMVTLLSWSSFGRWLGPGWVWLVTHEEPEVSVLAGSGRRGTRNPLYFPFSRRRSTVATQSVMNRVTSVLFFTSFGNLFRTGKRKRKKETRAGVRNLGNWGIWWVSDRLTVNFE